MLLLLFSLTCLPVLYVVLFLRARREHLAKHLKDKWETEDLQHLVRELRTQVSMCFLFASLGVPDVVHTPLDVCGLEAARFFTLATRCLSTSLPEKIRSGRFFSPQPSEIVALFSAVLFRSVTVHFALEDRYMGGYRARSRPLSGSRHVQV